MSCGALLLELWRLLLLSPFKSFGRFFTCADVVGPRFLSKIISTSDFSPPKMLHAERLIVKPVRTAALLSDENKDIWLDIMTTFTLFKM